MNVKSKHLFILIGNNNTGKTTFQNQLITKLCYRDKVYKNVPSNKIHDLWHVEFKKKYKRFFVAGRSFQELKTSSETVNDYHTNVFDNEEPDLAFLSSHLDENQIQLMINFGHARFYNVHAVFFSNSIENNRISNSEISLLNWQDRIIIDNPIIVNPKKEDIIARMGIITEHFIHTLVNKL